MNVFYPLRRRILAAAAIASALAWTGARAADHDAAMHHHLPSAGVKISTADYAVPAVTLLRDDGKKVSLPAELDDGRPVVLNFIFTTCPGICPIMSGVFSALQDELGAARNKIHMVSISIDPEQDTPSRLRAYAKKFGAGPQWQHYTGTAAASILVQKAFGAYRGDKMAHDPLTLVRSAPGQAWVRIDGFASAADLAGQLRHPAAGGMIGLR